MTGEEGKSGIHYHQSLLVRVNGGTNEDNSHREQNTIRNKIRPK